MANKPEQKPCTYPQCGCEHVYHLSDCKKEVPKILSFPPKDPEVEEWLKTVTDEQWQFATKLRDDLKGNMGTRGKMLIAKALESYASQFKREGVEGQKETRIAELEAENKRLRETSIPAFRELELLKNEYKRLREEHRWIPVTERLPEDEGIYVVLGPKYVEDPIVARWNNEGWFDNELDFHEDITDYVTHWIAIPQPPKEQ